MVYPSVLCGSPSDAMPVRLAQFYAFVLLLICLATNVAFFSDVREFFLGDEDPLASAQSAFVELDIAAKIAAFYPGIPSKIDDIADEHSPEPALLKPEPVSLDLFGNPQNRHSGANRNPDERPVSLDSGLHRNDSFQTGQLESLLPEPPSPKPTMPEPVLSEPMPPEPPPVPQKPEAEPTRGESKEEPQSADPFAAPAESPQEAAFDPFPQPAVAAVRPVIADQFKPIVTAPKPPVPVRPSSAPVWGTIETVLERPIRYD